MELTENLQRKAATALVGLSLLVSGCTAQDAPKNPSGKLHKDCYGMHIKEGKDITLEMYKEGENDRFRQAIKVARQDVEGALQKDPSGNWVLKTSDGKSYPVSQTAVEFNQFKEGQKMFGIVPADVANPSFCTLSLKRFRKELQKQEESAKIKTDQSLR